MKPETYHLVFSVSKSFLGLVAAIMMASQDVAIHDHDSVSQHVPDLAASAYGDATLRQVMDMCANVKFSENYDFCMPPCTQPDGIYYLCAADWITMCYSPCKPDCKPPECCSPCKLDLYKYPESLTEHEEEGRHEKFGYKSPNADVIAWVISNASKKPLSQLLSEHIWSKIGAESDAYYLVDPAGKEAAFGGLNVTLRDLARFGQMVLQKGRWNGHQVVTRSVIEEIMKGGARKAFADGNRCDTGLPWSYRSFWWINNQNGALMASGNYGQRLYIDPTAKFVVAKFGTHPEATFDSSNVLHQKAFDALAIAMTKRPGRFAHK